MPLKGASTAFTMPGAVANVTAINGWTEELEAIARNILADAAGSHQKFCAGDTIEHPPLELEAEFDPDLYASGGALADLTGTAVTGTLTFPIPSGGLGGATLAGTGFLKSRSFDGIERDQIIKATLMFQFDGATAPAWTAST